MTGGLDKEGLQEVQGMIDKGYDRVAGDIERLERYIKEHMVSVNACGQNRGNFDKKFLVYGGCLIAVTVFAGVEYLPYIIRFILA